VVGKWHELKTDADLFRGVITGAKGYEIRFDDRNFCENDVLVLRETVYTGEEMKSGKPLEYTGRVQIRVISHILRGPVYGLKEGWVILSFALRKTPDMEFELGGLI
jgi:hypothetical protein